MIRFLAIAVAAINISGCMSWPEEAEALRKEHGMAVAEAAATNQFEVIPPLEVQ